MAKKLTEAELQRARTGRTVAIVLVSAMGLWLVAQWLAPQFGLPGEYAILFDLFALATFLWAMIVSLRLWLARKKG